MADNIIKQGFQHVIDVVQRHQKVQDGWISALQSDVASLKNASIEHYGLRIEKENSDPEARCTYLYDASGFTPMSCSSDGTVSHGSWDNAFFMRQISSSEKSARKPRRPVLMPRIGICLSPTLIAVVRKVPSPPMLTAKSAWKASSVMS